MIDPPSENPAHQDPRFSSCWELVIRADLQDIPIERSLGLGIAQGDVWSKSEAGISVVRAY